MTATTDTEAGEIYRASGGEGLCAAVGFFFAFRLLITLLSVRLFGMDPRTGVGVGLALNFILLGMVALHAIGNSQQTLRSMLAPSSVRWVAFFLFFTACSLAWSSTVSLPAAAAFWCAMFADVAMVALLLRVHSAPVVASALMKGFVWGACLVAAIAWILPAQSDLRLGDEELLGPNQIGYLCAFAFFFAQYLMREKRGRWGLAALLLGVTLLRSLSKTTLAALLLSQAFLLFQDRSISRRTKALLMAGMVAIVLAFWGLLASYYDVYTNAGNQSETLTGRVGIWAYILDEAVQQPWFGHGFHSVWKVLPPFGPDRFEARHAHNELLQQFYAYGVVGVCMLVGLYGSFYRQLRKLPKEPRRTFFFSFLLFILIRGLADTEAFDLSLPLWAILLLSAVVQDSIARERSIPVHQMRTIDSGTPIVTPL